MHVGNILKYVTLFTLEDTMNPRELRETKKEIIRSKARSLKILNEIVVNEAMKISGADT